MTEATALSRTLLSSESPLALLLIEDSVSDGELVRALLADELPQAALTVATSLAQALHLLSQQRFDAILADLTVPDTEGLAVIRAIRDVHPYTALLVLTGRVDGTLGIWALAEGAKDYLIKDNDDGSRIATALLHALQRQLAENEAHNVVGLARGLLDAMEAPTCAVGADGVIIAVNKAWHSFMTTNGGGADGCAEGTNYLEVCERAPADTADGNDALTVAEGLRAVLAGHTDRFQYEYPCPGPEGERWFSVRVAPLEVDGARGAVISHVDVNALHIVQRTLSHQTLHDDLTGLPNRLLLIDRLEQALAEAARTDRATAVAFLGLDGFKRVNESLGHEVGDDLLVQVSQRMTAQLRSGDTVARFAGDEFVVISHADAEDAIETLGSRLIDVFQQPFEVGGTAVTLSASVGIALGHGSETGADLLQAADAAMYDAKRHSRGRVRPFRQDLRSGVAERMSIELGLRKALDNDELVLHYQPVMNAATGQPVGVEALVRWRHPERGLLGPQHFIPIAEASGLIEPLGIWVLGQACRDAVAFAEPYAQLEMAVNLSVRQLAQPDLLRQVAAALEATKLAPERLMLEVTESAVMEDEEAAGLALQGLADLGVRMAIDDLGTGYSPLLYLRRYPISALKIDRSFVAGIGLSRDDEAICSSVIGLAHAVGVNCIAEGVETPRQLAALRAFGCTLAQGYLWSPAVPIAELDGALAAACKVALATPTTRKRRATGTLEPAVAARIRILHQSGASLHTIAAAMNREAARTPRGGRWTSTAVAQHLSA